VLDSERKSVPPAASASLLCFSGKVILEDRRQVAVHYLPALDSPRKAVSGARNASWIARRHRLVAAARFSEQQQGKRGACLVGDRGAESGDRIRATEQRLLHAPKRVLAQFVGQVSARSSSLFARFEPPLQAGEREMGVDPATTSAGS